jgi:hypothetical protein
MSTSISLQYRDGRNHAGYLSMARDNIKMDLNEILYILDPGGSQTSSCEDTGVRLTADTT